MSTENELKYENKEPVEVNGKLTCYTFACLLLIAFSCPFQFGWNIGLYNIPVGVIQEFYNVSYQHTSVNNTFMTVMTIDIGTNLWLTTNGLLSVGTIIGSLSSGTVADYLGRKRSVLLVNIFVFIGGILNAISKPCGTYITIMIGRFFAGLCNGLFTGIGPMYLSELPTHNHRGLAGNLFQLFISIGLLITNIMGLPQVLGSETLWPYLVAGTVVPGLICILLGTPLLVESPKYLFLKQNKKNEARKVLEKLRGSNNIEYIEYEMKVMENEKANQVAQCSYKDLFTQPKYYRPLIIAIFIQLAQQFSGIIAVLFYSTTIFKYIGLEDYWPLYATVILSAIQVGMAFVTGILVGRFGRKTLLLTGLIGMAIFSIILVISGALIEKVDGLKYLSAVSTVGFIINFCLGPGPICWILTPELFNSSARGKGIGIATFVNSVANCLVAFLYPVIEAQIHSYTFLIFGVLLVLLSIYTYFQVPETKNKTSEEIQRLFDSSDDISLTRL